MSNYNHVEEATTPKKLTVLFFNSGKSRSYLFRDLSDQTVDLSIFYHKKGTILGWF